VVRGTPIKNYFFQTSLCCEPRGVIYALLGIASKLVHVSGAGLLTSSYDLAAIEVYIDNMWLVITKTRSLTCLGYVRVKDRLMVLRE